MGSAPLRLAIILIGVAIALNYIDRGAISVAAPLIKGELGLSNTDYGVIVSGFYWTYVPALALAGWLADRMSVHKLMAIGVGIWALATAGMGLAGGMVSLIALRLLMGLGEGVAFPCGSKLIAKVPEEARGLANVALSGGIALGPLIGALAGGLIMAQLGWRAMFVIFGLGTLLWLLPWATSRRGFEAVPTGSAAENAAPPVAYPRLLLTRQLWGMCALHFTGTYVLYFFLAWLPLWLVKARGYSLVDMTLLTSAFYLMQALGGALGGWAADRAIRAGKPSSGVRQRQVMFCSLVCIAGLIVLPRTQGWEQLLACIVVTGFCYGPMPNLLFAMGQTIAGPASAGRWVGLQASIGNLAGITGPVITGVIVDQMGYGPTFVLTAAIAAAGVIGWLILVRRIAPAF
ncbi:MFS transporter [Sandarakinorhabdus sp.]|uniref:MFS transporter n=1 Tax=Sandarakinorhabdus sp. TaxID=1916663 RepID=UPI00286E7F17|nr:MFS transporter [Sandarakinorhabdus sp.]